MSTVLPSRVCRMRQPIALVLLLIACLAWLPPVRAATPRFFPETGHNLADPMLTHWNTQGGLPVFGYPISEAFQEYNADAGATFFTQYFERNRFEHHPENKAPYHILLGRLGDEVLKQQGRDWRTSPPATPESPNYFVQTSHAIAHAPFWQYWKTHGLEFDGRRGFSQAESLALFGFPLSEPQMETNPSGDRVLTQWFERARFEDHGAEGVLLGLLGNETTITRRAEPPFLPVASRGQPSDAPSPVPTDVQNAGRQLFDRTNQRRQTEFGKAAFIYREDLQAIGDRIAQEWTDARKHGGDTRALIERYNTQLKALSPTAGVIYATLDVYLEAGCRNIDPHDPVAKAVSPYVANYEARTLTIGVHGPYASDCGRAFTAINIIGY
jgi:hypothetical protein